MLRVLSSQLAAPSRLSSAALTMAAPAAAAVAAGGAGLATAAAGLYDLWARADAPAPGEVGCMCHAAPG
jgi:hypothetical protein